MVGRVRGNLRRRSNFPAADFIYIQKIPAKMPCTTIAALVQHTMKEATFKKTSVFAWSPLPSFPNLVVSGTAAFALDDA